MDMSEERWLQLWSRVREARHSLVLGPGPLPPSPSDLKLLSVSVGSASLTTGPLEEARRRVDALLGETSAAISNGVPAWDAPPVAAAEAVFTARCNTLAEWAGGHAALLLSGLEQMDEVTAQALVRALASGCLRLPLILVASRVDGPVQLLIQEFQRQEDTAALIDNPAPVPSPAEMRVFDWRTLSASALRVLRAAAVVGTTFDARLVAQLLGLSPGSVLEHLQEAADAGAPLADGGEGRFSLPEDTRQALLERLLPSLCAHWHEQLGGLLSRQDAIQEIAQSILSDAETPPPPSTESDDDAAGVAHAELFEETEPSVQTTASEPPPATAEAPVSAASEPEPTPHEDPARAAAHLQAAGRTEAAVRRYLTAVEELGARGDARRGYALANQALGLLDELPPADNRQLLRARLLLARARLQWQGAVLGSPFTLGEALASLDEANQALPASVPASLAGELAAATAGICCELGDLPSLEKALNELTAVSRDLQAAGEAVQAALLLNEQAHVYVRLGDPVRATRLLYQARELYQRLQQSHPKDPAVQLALADNDHLLGRLALHARVRPGREGEALRVSLGHVQSAEAIYRRLDNHRELARAWETMGRLYLQAGQWSAASEQLAQSLKLQQRLGDVTGLARSAAALAELAIHSGHWDEAVQWLGDSMQLNLQKGSPLGLAFNRQALEGLLQAAGSARLGRATVEQLQGLGRQLEEAEGVLGRLQLPGDDTRL